MLCLYSIVTNMNVYLIDWQCENKGLETATAVL